MGKKEKRNGLPLSDHVSCSYCTTVWTTSTGHIRFIRNCLLATQLSDHQKLRNSITAKL